MSLKVTFGRILQLFVSALISVLCRIFGRCVPRRFWYRASFLFSRVIASAGGNLVSPKWNVGQQSQTARLLHRFLDHLSGYGYFSIPVTIEGQDLLERYHACEGGFLCCTAHLPFVNLLGGHLQYLFGAERKVKLVSVFPNERNAVAVWNGPELSAIYPDGSVLLNIRRALRGGDCVIVLVDKEQGQPVSPNIFRFAQKANTPTLFYTAELMPDGSLLSRFLLPPHSVCRSDNDVAENVAFVEQQVDRILANGDRSERANAPRYVVVPENEAWLATLARMSEAKLSGLCGKLQTALDRGDYPERQRHVFQERLRIGRLELASRLDESASGQEPGGASHTAAMIQQA